MNCNIPRRVISYEAYHHRVNWLFLKKSITWSAKNVVRKRGQRLSASRHKATSSSSAITFAWRLWDTVMANPLRQPLGIQILRYWLWPAITTWMKGTDWANYLSFHDCLSFLGQPCFSPCQCQNAPKSVRHFLTNKRSNTLLKSCIHVL